MEISPIQLNTIEYVTIEMRAHPHAEVEKLEAALPVAAKSMVTFADDGHHFVVTHISQADKEFAFSFELEALALFGLDTEVCKDLYRNSFNPAVVAVNVATIMYSSMRDMLANLTARSPHGAALLPSVVIGPEDVSIDFSGNRDDVLKKQFCFSKEQLKILHEGLEAAERQGIAHELGKPKPKRKKAAKR